MSRQRLAIDSGHSHSQCCICDEEILQRVDSARRIANTRLRQLDVPNLVAGTSTISNVAVIYKGTNATFVSRGLLPRKGSLPRRHALHDTSPTIERGAPLLSQDRFRSRRIDGESIHHHRGHLWMESGGKIFNPNWTTYPSQKSGRAQLEFSAGSCPSHPDTESLLIHSVGCPSHP